MGSLNGSEIVSPTETTVYVMSCSAGSTTVDCRSGTGHNDASCNAGLQSDTGTDGQCGTADGATYPNTQTNYGSDTQCAVGNPSDTDFPPESGSTTWDCSCVNGGEPMLGCSASRSGAETDG